MDDIYWTWFWIVAIGGLYFLPLIIAHQRKVTNLGSVAVINIFLGWTLVGWVVALAMAARSTPPRETPVETKFRLCPNCNRHMSREARVCPHCHVESEPLIPHAGFWWFKGKDGEWQWLDETVRPTMWRWYRDGTPVSASATDRTPSHQLDPSIISPPGTERQTLERGDGGRPSVSGPSAELERLADLHARGLLNDEEFQQAKQQVLRA